MTTTIKHLLFALALGVASPAYAQQTLVATHHQKDFHVGVQLFEQKNYAAAQYHLQQYLLQKPEEQLTTEASYYLLLIALYQQDPTFEAVLQNFVQQHPTHPHTTQAYRLAGDYYFDQKDNEKAVYFYEKLNKTPQSPEEYKSLFRQGYIYFSREEYHKALPIFEQAKTGSHDYIYAADYYAGFIHYTQGRMPAALESLEKASSDAVYRKESNKIIPLIYYQQNNYKDLSAFLRKVEAAGDVLNNNQLFLMGDAYYYEKDYQLAARYYDQYYQNVGERTDRNVFFKLGYSLAAAGDNEKAATAYAHAADAQDSLAQVAAFNMGVAYLQSSNKQPALNAFDKVRQLGIVKNLQETGAFNYAKLSYELKDFAGTIAACNFFETNFPNSSYEDEMNELLTNSYLNSGDYLQALEYIDKIATKNYKLRITYQRLAFNKAVEYYNADQFKEAENLLQKSLKYPVNTELANSSYYWLGELHSYNQEYETALSFYNKIPASAPEYNEALYGKAYAAYNRKDYGNATQLFKQYLQKGSSDVNKTDAEVRLADCYYVQKQYDEALNLYDKASRMAGADLEYLYFQKGMTLVNTSYTDEALSTFSTLVQTYPQSKYVPAALYQKALLLFDNGKKPMAVEELMTLILQYPQSNYVPDALLRRAITFQLLNEQEKAIADYEQLLQQYANHPNSEDAIKALQELQSNGYNVANYDNLANSFAKSNPNSGAAVEGEFNAAKVFYDNGDYRKAVDALHRFIKKYPENTLVPDANYFLAMSYDQQNDYENALFAYSKVKGNYEVRALLRAGEIEQARSNYAQSVQKYEAALKNTPNKRYEGTALAGLTQGYFALKDFDKSKNFAQQLIDKGHTKLTALAELYMGRILLEKGDFANALLSLQKITQTYQDIYAAEAQYNIGVLLRKQQKFEESTKALIEVKNKFATHRSWLYEAFLLIADNYVSLGNKFQAKATLQSIIDNATDEKVKEKAKQQLAGL